MDKQRGLEPYTHPEPTFATEYPVSWVGIVTYIESGAQELYGPYADRDTAKNWLLLFSFTERAMHGKFTTEILTYSEYLEKVKDIQNQPRRTAFMERSK